MIDPCPYEIGQLHEFLEPHPHSEAGLQQSGRVQNQKLEKGST